MTEPICEHGVDHRYCEICHTPDAPTGNYFQYRPTDVPKLEDDMDAPKYDGHITITKNELGSYPLPGDPRYAPTDLGKPINDPCEGGKCTSLNDEVHGATHAVCQKHAPIEVWEQDILDICKGDPIAVTWIAKTHILLAEQKARMVEPFKNLNLRHDGYRAYVTIDGEEHCLTEWKHNEHGEIAEQVFDVIIKAISK